MKTTIHALKSISHMVKTYIHYNIVYNLSLHHAIHALKRISHMENPYAKKWTVICADMCMTKTHSKRNGNHTYRNVHDKNTLKKKW